MKEWNVNFFNFRGFHIPPVFDGGWHSSEDHPTGGDGNGFGFQVGKTFIGVSTGVKASGFGLKLPGGVLFGVATNQGEKDGQK